MKKVYMLITQDKYELPLAVADTSEELSKMLGLSSSAVASSICRAKQSGRKCRYIEVRIDENDMD